MHNNFYSALDKLLSQLGIYAAFVLAKTIVYFHIFYATFFSVITHFLIARSHRECACIFIHSHRLPF